MPWQFPLHNVDDSKFFPLTDERASVGKTSGTFNRLIAIMPTVHPTTHHFLSRSGGGFGHGGWMDGNHIIGLRDNRLEKELFGEPSGPSEQPASAHFEKCGGPIIPFEVTGFGVPAPITTFVGSQLDPVLLENISYARYNTPTPIQQYLVPIIATGRDLMSCVQVRPPVHFAHVRLPTFEHIRPTLVKRPASSSPSFPLPSPRALTPSQHQLGFHPTLTPLRLTLPR